jgi:hypothetical protein
VFGNPVYVKNFGLGLLPLLMLSFASLCTSTVEFLACFVFVFAYDFSCLPAASLADVELHHFPGKLIFILRNPSYTRVDSTERKENKSEALPFFLLRNCQCRGSGPLLPDPGWVFFPDPGFTSLSISSK